MENVNIVDIVHYTVVNKKDLEKVYEIVTSIKQQKAKSLNSIKAYIPLTLCIYAVYSKVVFVNQ